MSRSIWRIFFREADHAVADGVSAAAHTPATHELTGAVREGGGVSRTAEGAIAREEAEAARAAPTHSAPPKPAKPGGIPGYIVRNPVKVGAGIGAVALGVGGGIALSQLDIGQALKDGEKAVVDALKDAEKFAEAELDKLGNSIANSPIAKAVGVGGATLLITMGAIFVVYEGYTLFKRA